MQNFDYLNQLIQDCEITKQAISGACFIYSDAMVLPAKCSAIYIIREIGGDPQYTYDAFLAFKSQFKHLKTAQPNHPSQILYVGSCTTKLKNRLEQHTLKCNQHTHALRLYEWFTGNYEIEIQLYDVSKSFLQLIEDNLAYNLKPAFGKRGNNNK